MFRPIVLIGAPGVGRNELKQKLLAYDPVHFKTTIPYTSRAPKPWEEEGRDYYFCSRSDLERGIARSGFLESGEYLGNLYGTRLDSALALARSGRVCLLNPHPQALKLLCTAELKPYVVFVKPPPFEAFKATRANAQSSFEDACARGFTDEELRRVLEQSRCIESAFGHRFDCELVNEDLQQALEELLRILAAVEALPQWAPMDWVLSP